MGRIRKIILYSVGILAVIIIAAYFILPPVLKSFLIKTLAENLHREVALKEVSVNPLRLTVTLEAFQVKDRSSKDNFVSFDKLFLNIDTFSIFRKALILKEITLTNPFIRITRNEVGSYNFSDLIPQNKAKEEKKSPPLKFSLNNIRIENGGIDFWDGPKKTTHTTRKTTVRIPFISNTAHYTDVFITPYFSAIINGSPYTLQGKTKPFADSLETTIDIDIRNFNIPHYMPYVPLQMNFKILSGLLDAKANISFVQYRDKKPSLTIKGDTTVKDLAADEQRRQRFLRIPMLQISAHALEPLVSSYHLSKIVLSSPELIVRRSKTGSINLLSLLPPQKGEKDKKPLIVKIDDLQIDDGNFQFSDAKPAREVRFDIGSISLKGENISTEKNAKADMSLSLRLDKTGMISATGPVVIDPLSAKLATDFQSIDLRKIQPYIEDKMNINIIRGKVSTSGNLTLVSKGKEGLSAAYQGKVLFAKFASIDTENGDDLLKWNSLFFNNMQVRYNPFLLHVNDISLTDFYARIVLLTDGTFNLQHLVEEDTAPKPTAASSVKEKPAPAGKPLKDIKINTISLQGGTIDFQDENIKPAFNTRLVEIGGRVFGLSSIASKPADVELRGKLDNYAPLEITGRIDPLKENLFLDLKSTFKDIDLTAVSPYSGKYAGYKIQKGKLSFELRYLILDKKLDSQNKIFLNQFTFGDPVDSPQATKLPVRLAVSLLKDRNGEINLDVPVSGTLDDPQFSVWRIVVQVIVNLLTRAATAPFALLGSLFGSGEELSYIEFDYGSYTIGSANLKKIETLTKALQERPQLKLEVEGHVDIEKDREGLKQNQFDKKLKVQKLNDLIRNGRTDVALDTIQIEKDEYEKYLIMAYRVEKFPKPRTAIGMEKKLPADEMLKLMMTNLKINDNDLRLLASQRVMQIKDLLLKNGAISPDRIFIVEPKTLAPEKKEKVQDSRVDFRLK
jgi:hypothetical protein